MKLAYWLLAAALLAGSVHAVPHYGPGPVGPGAPAQAGNPAVPLRAGMDRLLAFLGGEEKPSEDALARFLNTEIAPFFDFDYMAKSAGGRVYEQLNADRQRAMVVDIKRTFLTKMAEKLGSYDNQRVRFLPPRAGNDRRTAQVPVVVLNPGSYPARLEFRLYRDGERWRVYDVAANGQSAIVHFRRQLMRQVQERRMRQMRQAMPSMRQMAPPIGPGGPPPGYARRPIR